MDMAEHYIAYFSPAGTTRRVAEIIERSLRRHGLDASLLDLGPGGGADLQALAGKVQADACLWLGTPVYVDRAVPQVLDFIASLPSAVTGAAVLFATWGGVCSGVALPEMAQHLRQKGWPCIGAAKVVAEHSSMWASEEPLGAGHPDAGDAQTIDALVDAVLEKLAVTPVVALAPEVLDYLPAERRAEAWDKSLAKVKAMFGPHQPDKNRCDGCGTCVEICPAGAFSWNDGCPLVDDDVCVRCHQCTRMCPQQAFAYDSVAMATRLRQLAAASPERAETEIFV